MAGDLEYFRKRLGEERVLAEAADSEQVRLVHRKLASLYAQRLAALDAADDSARDFDPIVHVSPIQARASLTSRA